MALECNVGGTDRIARISVGSALLGLGLLAPISRPLKVAAAILGAMGLATGVGRYCPASKALGRNTCEPVGAGVVRRGTRVVTFTS